MHEKKFKLPNCKECSVGFVELDESNWECISIFEKYSTQVFIDGMGGINTDSIRNILELEGYMGDEYKKLFHDLIIFLTTALSTQQNK